MEREPDRDPGWDDLFTEIEKGNNTYEFEWKGTRLYCSYYYETSNWGDGSREYEETLVTVNRVWVGDDFKLFEVTELIEDLADLDPISLGIEQALKHDSVAAKIEELAHERD
jgi:hypothetical protein